MSAGPALIAQVLADAGEPLHSAEIARRVLELPANPYRGRTPAASVAARLSTSAEFVRLAPATYGLAGMELSAEEAEWRERDAERRWADEAIREGLAAVHYGHDVGAANCLSCGKFKSEPAAVCGWCGDDPVATDSFTYNRAHGRAF